MKRNRQLSKTAKQATEQEYSARKVKPRVTKFASSPLRSGDRVKFGESVGSVVKSELFSDEDAIEFVRFDNSGGGLVCIDRKLLQVLEVYRD